MQKPKSTKHNSKDVKEMLDQDKDYQEMLDQHDTEWWHQIDLELEQQFDEQKVIDDINSDCCEGVSK
jgi:phage pi2 protein 07